MARRLIGWTTCLGALALITAPASGTAAPTVGDERMIFVDAAYVITFDAASVRIDGSARSARTHLYLPAADPDGYVLYTATDQIDCARGLARYAAASGQRPDGTTRPLPREKPGWQPIAADTAVSIIRDHLCKLTDTRHVFGITVLVPGPVAAHAAFALLKLGLNAKPIADLATQAYDDPTALRLALDRARVPAARRAAVTAALGALVADAAKPPPPIVPQPAAVRSGRAGQYVHSEMELVAGLWLKLDGTFDYGLTVGALDEAAHGTWSAAGDRIVLVPDADPRRRGNVDVRTWQVSGDGRRLMIVRPDGRMTFDRSR